MTAFKAGLTYLTRDGKLAGVDSIRDGDGALQGWVDYPEGRTKVCWHHTGRMSPYPAERCDSAMDLMPVETEGKPFWFIAEPGDPQLEALKQRNDRLDALEARARDMDRQLRSERAARHDQASVIGALAARVDELVERLDGTDRRVAAVNEGLKDVAGYVPTVERRLTDLGYKADGAHTRVKALNDSAMQVLTYLGLTMDGGKVVTDDRSRTVWAAIGALEASGVANMPRSVVQTFAMQASTIAELRQDLARIEDMLTAEKPSYDVAITMLEKRIAKIDGKGAEAYEGCVPDTKPAKASRLFPLKCDCEQCLADRAREANKPARKSLGWLNVTHDTPDIRGCFVVLHQTRAAADKMASRRRLACIEIFEGEGL